jgi:hypothetical protein
MPDYRCTVNEAGPATVGPTSNPNINVNLTDTLGSFANTWFYAGDGIQNQVLDVGIAAITRNKLVDVTAATPNAGGSPYTEITRMFESQPLPPIKPTLTFALVPPQMIGVSGLAFPPETALVVKLIERLPAKCGDVLSTAYPSTDSSGRFYGAILYYEARAGDDNFITAATAADQKTILASTGSCPPV